MNYMIPIAVFVPIAGAFLLPVAGKFSVKLRNWLALVLVAVSFIISCSMLPGALAGKVTSFSVPMPLGFDLAFTADILAVFMAIVSSFIGALIIFYSFSYISHYDNQNEYYVMVAMFLGSMMGIVYSSNLVFLYIFWEMTAIASWRLIGFYRGKTDVFRADKSFLVTGFGALMMLLGFVFVYSKTGSFDLALIKESLRTNPLPLIAVMLIMFGILSKSATLPFHTWLPDAGVAPSPVTALLHAAVLVKIGVYVFARLFIATFSIADVWHVVIPWIAAASAIVSAGAALIETDIKRIIAYSTVSQIAFIFLGLAVGGEIGIAGALLYILMHGLAKGGLFLCAGIVEQKTHTKDITRLGGLIYTMPVTAVSFLFCSLSVMGVPPFGGFFSKFMVMSAAFQNGGVALGATFLFGACLTILYLFRLFNMVFLGEAKTALVDEGSRSMVISVAALAILSLAGGIWISYPSTVAAAAVKQMLGI